MANGAPVYISHLPAAGLGQQALPNPSQGEITGQATARFAQAIGGLGAEVNAFGQQMVKINRATTKAERETQYLTDVSNLAQEFQNDPDPATATKRFEERATELRGRALDGLPQEDAAELGLKLQRQHISYAGSVRSRSVMRQADAYVANVDKQYDGLAKRYAEAGSDTDRATVIGELDATLNAGVRDGMMTAKSAEAYRQSLVKTGDMALAYRRIGANPAAALEALKDPQQYAGLDPVQREQLAAHAKQAAGEVQRRALEREAIFSPATAAFKAGMLIRPEHVEAIFDKAFIPQESGGNPNALSPKGAAGVAQIMPDTARMLVKKMGIGNWDGDSDWQVQQFLKENPAQTRAMGIQYFRDNITAFNGNLAPAIAAYHAGPGGAVRKAHEAATAKYGEGYSATQFLEFLPSGLNDGKKATGDYVRDIYRRMGVDVSKPGLSGTDAFRASDVVGNVFERQRAQENALYSDMTRKFGQQGEELAGAMERGLIVNPQMLAAVKAPLQLAAARGDATAFQHLRRIEEGEAIGPIVREAYGKTAPELEAGVAAMRSALAQNYLPAVARRLKVFEAVASEVTRGSREAQIDLAEKQGAGVTALDPRAIGSGDFAQMVAGRSVVSDGAFRRYAHTQQFFKAGEKEAFKARWEDLGENERFDLMRSVHGAASKGAFNAFISEIAGSDKFAQTAGLFMGASPGVARDILRGGSFLKLKELEPKADEIRSVMKTMFPAMPYPNSVREQLIEGALAVYAAERGKAATLYDATDKGALEKAFSRVLGPVTKIHGQKVPIPPGIPEWHVQELLSSRLLDKTLDSIGGAWGYNNEKLPARFVGANAQLLPADDRLGDHRMYRLVMGADARPLRDKDGKALVFDLPALVKQNRVDQDEATAAGTRFAREMDRHSRGTMVPPPAGIALPRPPVDRLDGVQLP